MTELALSQVFDAVVAEVPRRECIVQGTRRLDYATVAARTRALAQQLVATGLGSVRARAELQAWESGQSHVAIYMHNRPEYLETMMACFAGRAVPCNVNYRYAEAELVSLLRGMRARALVFEGCFAHQAARLRAQLPELQLLIQVESTAGEALAPGALAYEHVVSQPSAAELAAPSPDDLYILFTGGTTGAPKGVLWRQADIFMAALGGRDPRRGDLHSLYEARQRAADGGERVLPLPPMMHGAAHWMALRALLSGGTVVMQERVQHFDAHEALATAEREQVRALLVVGDAFGRPLLDALQERPYELKQLFAIINGGAPLQADVKRALLARLPGRLIIDAIGSSESGQQGMHISAGNQVQTGRFAPGSNACVLSEARDRVLASGSAELGWLAQSGRVPLGYLDDAARTHATFPTLGGVRYAVPGDRAYCSADGQFEVLGRDSTTINSGGEKIFVEEVEAVLKQHPAVYDALVCGRPSPRWGQEVCAVLQLRPSETATEAELLAHAAQQLARFKLPRVIVFRERIERSPSGKPDYAWARRQCGLEHT